MIRGSTLILAGADFQRLQEHLFPGDGLEAAAVLVCSRVTNGGVKLLVRELVTVPHEECERSSRHLTWPGEYIDMAIDIADQDDLSLVFIHSHPNGYPEFSNLDNESDGEIIPPVFASRRKSHAGVTVHGSAIMMPSGAIRARLYGGDGRASPDTVDLVAVYGNDASFFWGDQPLTADRPLAFSSQMTAELGNLSAAIIGVSGTGSIVAEQLMRMGLGQLILIDSDRVEEKNLNRILNATPDHARDAVLKVEAFTEAASIIRPDMDVIAVPREIGCRAAVEAIAQADLIFSCVDSEEGRHVADRVAQAFLQPLFDVGVTIPVRKPGGVTKIASIAGRIDYVYPGSPTLFDRGVYSASGLRAEELRKHDTRAYEQQVEEGYMPGANEEAPSVICVNMHGASAAVLEAVARLYRYRADSNEGFNRTEFDLVVGEHMKEPIQDLEARNLVRLGSGMLKPLLGLPSLEDDA
ncbi:ThiF family adenylyltransferase [Stenotrophomonas bentonitica]|uniref:ThiF family adenylyltransferase n=1 Tax=Stenotrophomonas bentonitica TaxID=1450134 RepID=UPI0036E5AA34